MNFLLKIFYSFAISAVLILPSSLDGEAVTDPEPEEEECGGFTEDIADYDPGVLPPLGTVIAAPDFNTYEPFKIKFVFIAKFDPEVEKRLEAAFDFVNKKLGDIVRAPRLKKKEIFLPRNLKTNGTSCAPLQCGSQEVPAEFGKPCELKNSTTVQDGSETYAENVQEFVGKVSMILFVTRDDSCTANARAKACYRELKRFRPTHGIVTVCRSQKAEMEALQLTMLHETLHAMITKLDGFTFPINPGYMNLGALGKDGLREASKGITWKETPRTFKNKSGGSFTLNLPLCITDNVVKFARTHFQCESVEGAELNMKENEPDTGHWSLRLFPDEILAPVSRPFRRLSNLTLGILQDSTWYLVDMSKAEPLVSSQPGELGCKIATEESCSGIVEDITDYGTVHRLGPVCDPKGLVKTPLCSAHQQLLLECDDSAASYTENCYFAATRGRGPANVSCSKMRYSKPNYAKYGLRAGNGTTCATFIKPPWTNKTLRAECVPYECLKRGMSLKFRPETGKETCDLTIASGDGFKIVEMKFDAAHCKELHSLQLITPDVKTICPDANKAMWSRLDYLTISASVLLFCALGNG